MSQAELSRKALALKEASKPATHPVEATDLVSEASIISTAATSPVGARAPPASEVRTILRMPQVETATGLKQSHIYDLIAQGRFPRGVKLSAQATGWFADEISEWQQSRPRAEGGWSPRDRKRQRSTSEAA
jgi:prophage regulatory protein